MSITFHLVCSKTKPIAGLAFPLSFSSTLFLSFLLITLVFVLDFLQFWITFISSYCEFKLKFVCLLFLAMAGD